MMNAALVWMVIAIVALAVEATNLNLIFLFGGLAALLAGTLAALSPAQSIRLQAAACSFRDTIGPPTAPSRSGKARWSKYSARTASYSSCSPSQRCRAVTTNNQLMERSCHTC
jgi:hypothetical protein